MQRTGASSKVAGAGGGGSLGNLYDDKVLVKYYTTSRCTHHICHHCLRYLTRSSPESSTNLGASRPFGKVEASLSPTSLVRTESVSFSQSFSLMAKVSLRKEIRRRVGTTCVYASSLGVGAHDNNLFGHHTAENPKIVTPS